MSKFSVNYEQLEADTAPKRSYKLSDVRHRIEKVAFDVVRFVDTDNIDNFWKIVRDGDDDVIVAMYEDEPMVATASVKSDTDWQAALNKSSSHITIFYKGDPIKNIALASIGVPAADGQVLARSLPKKLASDNVFVRNLINDLSEIERGILISKHPELKK